MQNLALLSTHPLHALLKDATGQAHRQLEHALALLDEPLSEGRIVAALRLFRAFHHSWEPALADRLGDAAFTDPRRRAHHAAHDLRVLTGEAGLSDSWPEAAALCDEADAALGSLYVMEGSTLGGKVIGARLQHAPWWPAGGLRYFDAHGALNGPLWRETLARIQRDALQPQRVAEGAVRTFELLRAAVPAPQPA